MSSYSGDAAEQVVRMSLEGTEVAVRLAGSGAKELAILLYAVLRDQKKTKGKVRLTNMLRSGRELKVFAVQDTDLRKFCIEAKKYGVLYTVLKDRDANDGLTDIMVRSEDAGKINRIFERFSLATVDMGSIKAQIEREIAAKSTDTGPEPPYRAMTHKEKVEEFLDRALNAGNSEEKQTQNPAEGRIARSRQSGPSSERRPLTARDVSDDPEQRPSVRKQLDEIRDEQKKTAEVSGRGRERQTRGQRSPGKNKNNKEERI